MFKVVRGALLTFSIFFGALAAFAEPPQIVVISDIDDTLKYARLQHHGHLFELVANALSQRAFAGMPELYQALAGPLVKFHYVSAIPTRISFLAKTFLFQNQFPYGEFNSRPSLRDPRLTYKVQTILKIADQNPDAILICNGDNGEMDPFVFAEVIKHLAVRRPEQLARSHFLIHALFDGPPLPKGIRGYFGSVGLAAWLRGRGFIDDSRFQLVKAAFERRLNSTRKSEHESAIPNWARPPEWALKLDSDQSDPIQEFWLQVQTEFLKLRGGVCGSALATSVGESN